MLFFSEMLLFLSDSSSLIILKASFVAYGSPVFGSRYFAGNPVTGQIAFSASVK